MTITQQFLRFPSWVDMDRWNQHQSSIFNEIIARFDEGNELVLLDDPCGGGKSLIANMVREYLNVPGYYLVGTKSLQDQLERTLGLPVIKGRANYVPNGVDEPTGHWQEPTCADCDYESRSDMCSFCTQPSSCPYTLAKEYASTDELPVANYSYALGEWTSPRSAFRNRGLVICDESDTIPDELMGFVSIDISPRSQQRLNLRPPDKKTVESSWASWFEYAIPHVEGERAVLYGRSLQVNRQRARLDKLIEKLRFVSEDLEGWVYEYDRDYLSFKPVMVDKIAPKYLWAHGERFLCMTGSGGSPEQFVADTGFDGPWAYVTAASTFPVERRPIYVAPFARMTKKTEEVERPKLAAALLEVIDMYPDAKMLVHTVSYSLTKYLLDAYADRYGAEGNDVSMDVGGRVFAYIGSHEKELAIKQFERVSNAVLLAPSLDRGYDNPDIDVCVICKVPSPYLGSKQIQKRLYETVGGSKWYANLTIQTLVQMYGRVMRCFSMDTELLTTEGWKKPEEVLVGDKVYGLYPDILSRPKPTRNGVPRLVQHEVEGIVLNESEPLVRLKAKSLDALLTPDHSLFVQPVKTSTYNVTHIKPYGIYEYRQRPYKWTANPYRKVAVRDLPQRFKMPLAGAVVRGLKTKTKLPDDWFWLMGFIISDGWISPDKAEVGIVQAKPETIPLIDGCIARLGLKVRRYEEQTAGTVAIGGYTRNYDKVQWVFAAYDAARIRDTFHNGKIHRYSTQFSHRKRSHKGVDGWKQVEKTIPRWVLQRANVRQLNQLLDGLMEGDGSWHNPNQAGTYYTNSRELADRVQEVLALIGCRSSIAERRDQFEVRFSRNGSVDCPTSTVVSEAEPGPTWCVKTTAGSVLVRRAGKTFIAGNSEMDSGETIILDSMFGVFYNKWKSWFPAHYREAVDFNSDVAWSIKQSLRGRSTP